MTLSSLLAGFVLIMILAIFVSLGSGLFYLVRDKGQTPRLARALLFRILLSFILFITLVIIFAMGWVTPHALFGG